MIDMWSERDLPIMSLWHDLLNNKEYMTRDGKYYVVDALLVDNCLMQQRAIESLEDENQKLRELVVESLQSKNNRLENENEKLRELSKYAILCSEGDVRCEACPYHDKTAEPHIICTMRKAAIELGIEVDG